MRLMVATGLVVLVAGCVADSTQDDYVRNERRRMAAAMVGKSEAYLLEVAGEPSFIDNSGGRHVLSYVAEPGQAPGVMARPGGMAMSWARATAMQQQEKCQTDFVIRAGLVASYSFTGGGC